MIIIRLIILIQTREKVILAQQSPEMFYLLAGMPTKLSYATCGRSKAKICFPPTIALSFVKLCVVAFHSLPNLLAYVVGDLLQRRSS